MIQIIPLLPGITLRCCGDTRFKQGCLSLQLVRPMCREEASLNALIPAVLIRGTEKSRDLREITLRLDDLYGAAVGTMVRRIGDYQTTGLSCSFIEDRYALPGEQVLEPMIRFLGELLLHPLTENGIFCRDYVESEKKNLISAIEAELNDKRTYAMGRMLKLMGRQDSFGIPRMGTKEDAAAITAESAWAHYRKALEESPIEIFYVGTASAEKLAELLKEVFRDLPRSPKALSAQTPFHVMEPQTVREQLDVTQAQLCMGFTTPITNQDSRFAAMQVANALYGAGMTSKLFLNVREKMSLCYTVGSSYSGTKGIMTVSAGLDADKAPVAQQEILDQLKACTEGRISSEELTAAKEAILSALRATHDSPGAIESFYANASLSGLNRTVEQYKEEVRAVTAEQAAAAAATLTLNTVYTLEGVKA